MHLSELSSLLREKADEIDNLAASLVVPTQERFSIRDAFERLRLACGPRLHITIQPPEIVSYGSGAMKAEPWQVYLGCPDGRAAAIGHSEGATLDQAVNAALAAHRKIVDPESGAPSVDDAIAETTETLAEPLPL
jgi:hypothetical protein